MVCQERSVQFDPLHAQGIRDRGQRLADSRRASALSAHATASETRQTHTIAQKMPALRRDQLLDRRGAILGRRPHRNRQAIEQRMPCAPKRHVVELEMPLTIHASGAFPGEYRGQLRPTVSHAHAAGQSEYRVVQQSAVYGTRR